MTDDKKEGARIAVIGTGATNMHALAGLVGAQVGQATINDPIEAAPRIQGQYGKAWLANTAEGRRQLNVRDDDDAGVAHWIVEAPWAHPAWHSYSICLCHLRALRTPRPTLFYLEGATHEIWVYAMDPTADRRAVIATGIVTGQWLTPINFAGQFIEVSDELARTRVAKAVQEICEGRLSPDTDHARAWKALFGDHMLKDRPKPITPKEIIL